MASDNRPKDDAIADLIKHMPQWNAAVVALAVWYGCKNKELYVIAAAVGIPPSNIVHVVEFWQRKLKGRS